MVFRKDIWGIGTFSCHGWLWVTCLVSKHHLLLHHHISFYLVNQKSNLPTSIHRKAMIVFDLDDPNVQMWTCDHRADFFKKIMPIVAFKNLVIVQHWNTLSYANIYGEGYKGTSTIKWAKPNSFVLFKRVRTWNWKLRLDTSIAQNLWFNRIFDLYNIFLQENLDF
jgi:hypothetical protein